MSTASLMKDPLPTPLATAEDLHRVDREGRFEVIGGQVVPRAASSFEHSNAQGAILAQMRPPYHRKSGGDRPGGWWIGVEVEIELARHEVYIPDLSGWRRTNGGERPAGRPVRIRPDWVCEVLSPSNSRRDLQVKHREYHRFGVPHYWIVDPDGQELTVYRWQAEGYLCVLLATAGERVRAEPFDAIELVLDDVFGIEEEGP